MAGVGELAASLQAAHSWTPFFAVDDAGAIAARIHERGGTVAVGPLSLGIGRAALAADRDGAVFGFWEGATPPGWSVGRGRAPAWLELRTRDALAAALFYGEVFGWASEGGLCSVRYEHDEVIVYEAECKVASLRGKAVEAAPDPQLRPRWYVHFRVSDVDAAVAAARAAGGTVATAPTDLSAGRQATLRDPDGGLFLVTAA
ncbi:VOC family protein [Streptomyces sp. 6N106]|uniref:VOC family protein n=1 Tax=Streptomyces sp. 6N106 TaxID=3457418 RepID=UPI003FD640DB